VSYNVTTGAPKTLVKIGAFLELQQFFFCKIDTVWRGEFSWHRNPLKANICARCHDWHCYFLCYNGSLFTFSLEKCIL